MRKLTVILSSLIACLAVGSLLAALLQCPKCGYEYTDGAAKCNHCGKDLPKTAAPAQVAAVKPTITRATLAAELAAVDRAEDEDRHATTLLRARNTLALLKLSSDANTPKPAEIIRAIADSERAIRENTEPCFGCRGSGKRIYSMADMRGNVVKQSAAAGTVGCPVCKGDGTLKAASSTVRITARMASARQRFDRFQQARGWEEYGGIWMPPDTLATLDTRQKATLKTTAASACATCHGFGTFGCAICKGVGGIKCDNDKCIQGYETCTVCKGKRKIADPSSARGVERTCTGCAGAGIASCGNCVGRALIPCTKCESSGRAQCSTCKGAGEPPNCTKCDGTGLGPCRTCRGVGEVKGVTCTTCQGSKETTCSTCTGTGHAKR